MTVAVEAIYENGVLKLQKPVGLKEHARVRVMIEDDSEASAATEDDDPMGWKTARELVGCIKDGPEELAENHDHYLYGAPRK